PSRSVCLHHQSVSSDCGTHLDLHSFPTRRSSDLKGLVDLGYEVLSTGGTLRAIAEANIPVTAVDEITGFPEILDGRVKTLHPNIHGGLLAKRDQKEHMEALKENHIEPIDVVIVNLYPFKETLQKPGVSEDEIIENIDIGGPSMLRAAAKNFKDVLVIVDP